MAAESNENTGTTSAGDDDDSSSGSSESSAGTSEAGEDTAGDLPEQWSCLDDPAGVQETGAQHSYAVRVVDVNGSIPPQNLSIRLCASFDARCDNPSPQEIAVDETGRFEAQVESGFEGYFEIFGDAILPTLLWLQGPVTGDVPEGLPITLIPGPVLEAIANDSGYDLSDDRGLVVIITSDCEDRRGSGIRYVLRPEDDEAIPFYLSGLLPALDASSTDDSGMGGFLNAPTGVVRADVLLDDGGLLLAQRAFQVRAGSMTIVPVGSR